MLPLGEEARVDGEAAVNRNHGKTHTLQQHHSTAVKAEGHLPKVAVHTDKDEVEEVGRRRHEVYDNGERRTFHLTFQSGLVIRQVSPRTSSSDGELSMIQQHTCAAVHDE